MPKTGTLNIEFWRNEVEREGDFGGLQKGALCAPKRVAGGSLATWDGTWGRAELPAALGAALAILGCLSIERSVERLFPIEVDHLLIARIA